jgi:pimeloyl-ACP methyl ester carboxylesterase
MTAPGFREQRWISFDGLELYARIYDGYGAGTRAASGALKVLCLPGLTRNSRDFEELAPHLAKRYHVVCPDLRGRGFSARDPYWQNYHAGTYLSDIAQLMTILRFERVAIIGTSLGGILGMALGANAPERVAGIVLNDVGPEVDTEGLERIKNYVGKLPPVRTWAEAIVQLRAVYERAWPGLSGETWSMLARRSYRADESGIPVLDFDPMVGDALRSAPANPDGLWPIYAQLKSIPMLAIHGALSDILTTRVWERMRHEKPDLERVTIRNRGHVPLLDEPDAVAAIDLFLSRLKQ